MEPTLRVSERGQTRWVTGEATQPTTAMVKVDPDAVVRSAIDAQSAAVKDYLRSVARTVDQAPQRSPTGYSNDSELRARNTRFFFTVGAYIALAAVVSWGIVSLATLADVIDAGWHWPMWLAATGAMALWLVRTTHALEAHLTPEGIEATRADADAYATEKAADGQHAIAQAVAEAITWRAQSEYADSQARQIATEAAFERILPQRQLTVAPAELTYSQQAPIDIVWRPATPSTACLMLCDAVSKLYESCQQRGSDLVTTRLEWSQRGSWDAQQKRRCLDTLSQFDPPLLIAGDGGRWRLNRAAWPLPIALSAIRRRWPRD